jgi:hypothetical protein
VRSRRKPSDPAADWPALAPAFDATIHVTNRNGARKIPAETFFTDIFTTAFMQEDARAHVELPQPVAGAGSAYVKIAYPASGSAGEAVVPTLDGEGGYDGRGLLLREWLQPHVNRLANFDPVSASNFGSDSHLMNFSAELAVLQRGNQRHASRYSNFVDSAEWVGYRERK